MKNMYYRRSVVVGGVILLALLLGSIWLAMDPIRLINMWRVAEWVEENEGEWDQLCIARPALRDVSILPDTANNGMTGILLPKLGAEDELALYRFVLRRSPPRPVHLVENCTGLGVEFPKQFLGHKPISGEAGGVVGGDQPTDDDSASDEPAPENRE